MKAEGRGEPKVFQGQFNKNANSSRVAMSCINILT